MVGRFVAPPRPSPRRPVTRLRPIRVCVSSRDTRRVRVTRFLLERRGFATCAAGSLGETRDVVRRERVDVVVLDATRALADAIEAAEAIRGSAPHAGVVLVGDAGGARPLSNIPLVRGWDELPGLAAAIEHVYVRERARGHESAAPLAKRRARTR